MSLNSDMYIRIQMY